MEPVQARWLPGAGGGGGARRAPRAVALLRVTLGAGRTGVRTHRTRSRSGNVAATEATRGNSPRRRSGPCRPQAARGDAVGRETSSGPRPARLPWPAAALLGFGFTPLSGGTPGPLCTPGSPRFSTRGPVTLPELLSQALRYGEEPSRNRPASRSPCAARRPRTARCPSADGEPARPPRPPLEAQSPGGAGRARGQCCSSSPHPAQPGPKGARSTPAKPDRRKPLCTPRAKDTLLLSPWRSHREPLLPRQRSGRDFEPEARAQQFPAQRREQLTGARPKRASVNRGRGRLGGSWATAGKGSGARRAEAFFSAVFAAYLSASLAWAWRVPPARHRDPRACPGHTVPARQPPFSSGRARRRRTAAERPGFAVTDDAGCPACRGRKA